MLLYMKTGYFVGPASCWKKLQVIASYHQARKSEGSDFKTPVFSMYFWAGYRAFEMALHFADVNSSHS